MNRREFLASAAAAVAAVKAPDMFATVPVQWLDLPPRLRYEIHVAAKLEPHTPFVCPCGGGEYWRDGKRVAKWDSPGAV